MKKQQSLRSVLGLTQDEMALILQVDRSRFAKYEAGSRDLPLAAKQLLAELLKHMNEETFKTKAMDQQYIQKLKVVESMLKENKYQQEATAREIKSLEKKYIGKLKALQIVEFLSMQDKAKDPNKAAILRSIRHKADKGLKLQGLDTLFKLELKLEMLQMEKLFLDHAVIKTNRVLENIGSKE